MPLYSKARLLKVTKVQYGMKYEALSRRCRENLNENLSENVKKA
jgi:hypothetical protein